MITSGNEAIEVMSGTGLEADELLLPIPSAFPPDVISIGAQADWLATEHLRLYGDENDTEEFYRLIDCYLEKLQPGQYYDGTPSRLTVGDLAVIRQAILTILDDGDPTTPRAINGGFMWSPAWRLYDADEAEANEQRLRFADAVRDYLIDRLAPQLRKEKG